MASTMRASIGQPGTVALMALPVAIPVAYLFYMSRAIRRSTTSTTGRRDQPLSLGAASSPPPRDPASLPADVEANSSQWVVAYERVVSDPVPASSLAYAVAHPGSELAPPTRPSPLLRAYIRATHVAFSWTPQAFLIRAMIKEADVRRTFDGAWIDSMAFAPGELVNGVYRVSQHQRDDSTGSERAELTMEVPASFKGPVVRGLLVAAIEPVAATDSRGRGGTDEGDMVVFVNETWMWRRAEEKPTMLETPMGKWFHGKLAGWLILKGLGAVVGASKPKTH